MSTRSWVSGRSPVSAVAATVLLVLVSLLLASLMLVTTGVSGAAAEGETSTTTPTATAEEADPRACVPDKANGWFSDDVVNKARFAGPNANGVVTFWSYDPEMAYFIDVTEGPNHKADGTSFGFTNKGSYGFVGGKYPCDYLKIAKCGVASTLFLSGDGGFDQVRLPGWPCPPQVKITNVAKYDRTAKKVTVRVSGTVNHLSRLTGMRIVFQRTSNVPAGKCVWLNKDGVTFTTYKVNNACSAPSAAKLSVNRTDGKWAKAVRLNRYSSWRTTVIATWSTTTKWSTTTFKTG